MNARTRHTRLAALESDPRWTAVLTRDAAADGRFWYSVKTTGVYCRPSCAARRPAPENIAFHATREDAERAGFRPCRRCRPDQADPAAQQAERIAAACRLIEAAEAPPSLDELAAHAGLSRHHFHRLFRAIVGLTPKDYAAAIRARRLRQNLSRGDEVTTAMLEAGYNSSARLYADSDATLGMTPSRYRAGGAGMDIRYATGTCSLGAILVAQTGRGICAVLLGDTQEALVSQLADRFPHAQLGTADAAFVALLAQVVDFVDAPAARFALPLDIRGTAFQQRVWHALRAIPPGETVSYTELARRIGAPAAVRAVASACAANALAVLVPCHRVLRSDGSLSGYRWGVARKRALLGRESGSDQNQE